MIGNVPLIGSMIYHCDRNLIRKILLSPLGGGGGPINNVWNNLSKSLITLHYILCFYVVEYLVNLFIDTRLCSNCF